jgi:hypothetical protein
LEHSSPSLTALATASNVSHSRLKDTNLSAARGHSSDYPLPADAVEKVAGHGSARNSPIARCPQGQQLAGFDLRVGEINQAGDGVFAIQPICATALASAVAGPLQPYPSRIGGTGSRTVRLVCPSNSPVVTRISIEVEQKVGAGWED